jgi:hypothetical protein
LSEYYIVIDNSFQTLQAPFLAVDGKKESWKTRRIQQKKKTDAWRATDIAKLSALALIVSAAATQEHRQSVLCSCNQSSINKLFS